MSTSLTRRSEEADVPATDAAEAAPSPRVWLRPSRVVPAAVGLILVQLGYRAWATFTSWYTFDDYTFMSKLANEGSSPDLALEPYAGHVMPAGMYLSWLADHVAPYDFRVNAAMLVLMQLLANVGLLVMLVRLFGARWGILPPLVVYLFCTISVPVAIWWAAGVNQLPLQIVLFWGMAAHVSYLRSTRPRHLAAAVLWVLAGLLFYEKCLLVIGAYAIVTLAYFTTGDLRGRIGEAWQRYRGATVLYAATGVAYLAFYAQAALNFSPQQAGNDALGEVITNMVFSGYLPAVLGGPLQWDKIGQFSLASPNDAIVLGSVVIWGLVLREIHRSRSRSLRAWFLPAFFLGCDVVLVLAGRVSFVGALISLDFRYQGELPAVTAVALACATMPILGARDQVRVRGTSELLDRPDRVAAATAAVAALSLVSSTAYVTYWSDTMKARPYFDRLLPTVQAAKEPIPLVDTAVPGFVMWELGYPGNLFSHILLPYSSHTDYRVVATDELNIVDSTGVVVPAVVTGVRHSLPGPRKSCGYALRGDARSIPLDGPVAFGGWWVRMGYLSSETSPVVVTAGDATYSTVLKAGVHALYFRGGGQFNSIELSGLRPGVTMCTDDVLVGRIRPVSEPEDTP